MSDWIETYTGKKFYPLDPRPEDVDIQDIAHSLSMQCRFNGHTRVFYSVAEHSLIVSEELALQGYDKLLQLYGLLHDAAEAYICDLPRPIKNRIRTYNRTERLIMSVIWTAFNLPAPLKTQQLAITCVDDQLLGYEGRKLTGNTDNWIRKFGNFTPKSTKALGVSPGTAKERFLSRFNELTGW